MKAAAKSKPVVSPPGKKKKPAPGRRRKSRATPRRRSRARAVPAPLPKPTKTASVRDLRNNFAMLSAWLEQGFDVEIMKNGEPYALLTLEREEAVVMPDFFARARTLCKGKVYDTSGWMAELRKERF